MRTTVFDTAVIHGDGTTTAAKKGGDNLGSSGRRKVQGDKVVAFCDRHCNVIAPFVTAPGNRNESPLLREALPGVMRIDREAWTFRMPSSASMAPTTRAAIAPSPRLRDPSCKRPLRLTPSMGRLSDEALEDGGKMRLGLKSDGQSDIHYRHSVCGQHLLSAFNPSPNQVFVRPQAGGRFELRGEIYTREAGCRSDVGETYGFGKTGLDIVDRSLKPPSDQPGYFRSLRSIGSIGRDQEPYDDGGANAVHIKLPENTGKIFGAQQGAPKPLQLRIARRGKSRTDLRRLTVRHFAHTLGNQLVGHVEVERVVRTTEDAVTTNGGRCDEKRSGHGGSVQHGAAG
jgi:hypothetical protein